MKTFKKLAAFLLSMSMCASIVGCGLSSGSTNNSGTNSTPPANSDTNTGTEYQDNASGAAYIAALETQLKAANTIKMSVITSSEADQSTHGYYWQQEKVEYTIAKTQTGYNAYIKVTTQDLYEKGGTPETEISEEYIIDGVQYYYDDYEGCYVPLEGYISTGLSSIIEFSNAMTEEESAALRELLAQAFDESVEVTNAQAIFTNDLKDECNAVLDYIGAIDPEIKTMGGVINDAIAVFAEGVTIQGILAEIEGIDTMTIGQAETAIDAYLQETAEMTLQEFKQALLEDERVVSILTTEMGLDLEKIEQFKQLTLKEILGYSENQLFDELVYDVMMMITASANSAEGVEEELPTYEQFLAGLEERSFDSVISYLVSTAYEFCDATINKFMEEFGVEDISQALQMYQQIDFTEAVIGATITFGNLLNISNAKVFLNYACEGMFPIDPTRLVPITATASIVCSIDLISADVTTIALPNA